MHSPSSNDMPGACESAGASAAGARGLSCLWKEWGPRFVTLAMAGIAIAKLAFVAPYEVVAEPFDAEGYAAIAEHWYWGMNYGLSTSYCRQPGFPLFIAAIHALGIPFRIAVEGCFLIACFTLCTALWPRLEDGFYRVITFSLMAFQPATITEFCRLYPDGGYCIVLTFALGSILLAARKLGTRSAVGYSFMAGCAFALLTNMRQETVLIYGLLAVLGIAEAAGRYLGWIAGPWKHRVLCLILIPFACIAGSVLAVKTANYFRIGSFVAYDMEIPGFKNLFRAVLRIRPDQPGQYVCAPRDVRRKAYHVSATFKEMKRYFEGPESEANKRDAKFNTGVADQFSGNFDWALRGYGFMAAAAKSGKAQGWSSAREADVFFQRAADEINAGIKTGKIPGRFVFSSYLDPDLPKYLPQLPRMIMNFGDVAMKPTLNVRGGPAFFEGFLGNFRDDPTVDLALFNRMANRRATLVEGLRADQRPLELQQRSWHVTGPMHWFLRINAWVVRLVIPAFLGALLLSLLAARARVPGAAVQCVCCLALAYIVASRFLLFSVVALVLQWAVWNSQRYILPVLPILNALFVFCGSVILASARCVWKLHFRGNSRIEMKKMDRIA